ncbi:MAG: hypothetical protein V2B17_01330 [Chloroflexota bacterium]
MDGLGRAGAWAVPDSASYALALDGAKRRMDAIGSNQGHALWSGIVADEHAPLVAELLGGPGLDSGWGLRTYAAGQPGYTPLGYHTGAVWPHDTAIAIAGLRRCGLDEAATRLAGELFAAARALPAGRLPELFCGFGSDEVEAPVLHPASCAPQAWSAAAPLLALRAMLGLRPRAAEGMLEVDHPCLPAGLCSLRLLGLRVGPARLDLLFHRRGGVTAVKVLRTTGQVAVVIRA